ncbi:MAG: hypothetical protein IKP88_12295 [Lachnospiraceae bacterium]|nr:hypothetical protein [Lachnospiraceae bacterium]
MRFITSGNAAVDALGYINITGNITPNTWYKTITRENGKPNLLAISLLSDIVYWYRPEEIRDERSGNTIGWKKRFKGDLLQKSYKDYINFFGESKRSIRAALDYLESLGVIKKLFRDIETETGNIIYNVMYIELFPDVLEKLTFDIPDEKDSQNEKENEDEFESEDDELQVDESERRTSDSHISRDKTVDFEDYDKYESEEYANLSSIADDYEVPDEDEDPETIEITYSKRGCTKGCTPSYNEMYPPIQNDVRGYTKGCTPPYNEMYPPIQNDVRGYTKECTPLVQKNVPPPTKFCPTYTENTTETTTEITTKNTTEITNRDNNIIILSSDGKETPRDQSAKMTVMMNENEYRQRTIRERETYISLIKKNIGYDILMKERKTDKELLEELFQIMCDVVCNKREKVEVNRTQYDYEIVKAQFLKINVEHIRCVLLSMKENVSKINNMRGYLITALYNSVYTIGHYYQSKVNHDWHGDERIELEWGNKKGGGSY